MRRKRKENIILKELILQIEGLIEIEIGNYADIKGLELYIENHNYSSIDVYIKNEHYTDDDYLMYGDREHLIHLHREDLLWFIMNFNKNKKQYFKLIDDYTILLNSVDLKSINKVADKLNKKIQDKLKR